jgi:prophage maintenance system killer protein
MTFEQGELIFYQSEDGQTTVDVQLQDETVWLSQAQMVELFQKTKQNVSLHIRNLFREGELQEEAVVKESLTTGSDGKRYKIKLYNLDVIISVGYRVKSRHGTQFRIWATSVLKDHLVKGYTLNQNRLAEKEFGEARQMLELLSNTLESHNLVSDEGMSVLNIVNRYSRTWQLLWQYDEDSLDLPKKEKKDGMVLELDSAREAIVSLRQDLLGKSEATDIFGNERSDGLAGIIGAIHQTFGGEDLYPGVEEKAANLLYFVIKDHPFTDGNKRIGSFLFLLFLQVNGQLDEMHFDNKALVALTLLIAASSPDQKDLLIRLVVNLLTEG